MKTVEGENFNIPQGRWRHIKKSFEWERLHKNEAKGMIGKFSASSNKHLRWDSLDGTVSMFAEVRTIKTDGTNLYVRHRSGLEYWYKKEH